MKGYSKILGCCKQAILDGWEYAWIDSCCIDKTSSAELSEAITSMFLWYKEAQVCYAFLSDVPSMRGCSEDTTKKSLAESKWFTRGWTLQELLAPDFLVFYDEHWEEIGTKFSLADVIQQRTGIKDLRRWNEACVAQKMYWASRRETTRAEDLAYSLLGIFGVYMPPLYVSIFLFASFEHRWMFRILELLESRVSKWYYITDPQSSCRARAIMPSKDCSSKLSTSLATSPSLLGP